mgnify:CR=1 FL=1
MGHAATSSGPKRPKTTGARSPGYRTCNTGGSPSRRTRCATLCGARRQTAACQELWPRWTKHRGAELKFTIHTLRVRRHPIQLRSGEGSRCCCICRSVSRRDVGSKRSLRARRLKQWPQTQPRVLQEQVRMWHQSLCNSDGLCAGCLACSNRIGQSFCHTIALVV